MELTHDDVVRILALIDESPMGRVCVQVGDFKLEVVKGDTPGSGAARPPETVHAAPPVPQPAPGAPPPPEDSEPNPAPATVEPGLLVIKAPLLGIFYRRPQPGSPPYVEEGSLVSEDTTVALIEVMKLFTPVRAGVTGRIQRIFVKDHELVEYDQNLFLVNPE